MADKYQDEIVKPGDQASRLAHEICVESFDNCPALEVIPRQPGNFRGLVDWLWRLHILQGMIKRQVKETMQNDGAGGKPQFFTLLNSAEAFFYLGWEILVMCIDDIVRTGGFPAIGCNDINVKRITKENFHLVEAMLRGYGEALRKCGVVNITGEIAIMKHSITAFCDFNSLDQLIVTWGGTFVGLTKDDKIIDGTKIRPGNLIVGFWEPGYRCNGGTAFTEIIMALTGGDLGRLSYNKDLMSLVKKLTIPSVSYAKLICEANGWQPNGLPSKAPVQMNGIAHITGGGVWGKLGDLLPAGCGALLDKMPIPAGVLLEAQELSWNLPGLRIDDRAAYGTFHGGCGMLVAVESANDSSQLIKMAAEHGIVASEVGVITASAEKEIIIKSRFKEKRLLSSLKE